MTQLCFHRSLCVIISTLLLLGGVQGASPANYRTCDFTGLDSPILDIGISNRDMTGARLRIPLAYIVSRPVYDGIERDGIFLTFDGYSLAPWPTKKTSKPPLRGRPPNKILLVISHLKPIEVIAKLSLYRPNYENPFGSDEVDLEGVSLDNGLFGQRIRAKPRFSDVFLGRQGDAITDVIRCDQPGDVPYPGCTHLFEVGAYDLTISYARTELDRWRTLRGNISSFIRCLTIVTPQEAGN